MSLTVQIHPRIGQLLRQYRKRSGQTQQALGEALDQVLASRGAPSGTGFSKSTISRIEKGLFLPPQNKLEILCQLLEIPAAEAQELFTLCGYTPTLTPDTLPTRIAVLQRQVQEAPTDVLAWLELVSMLNQERQFNAMQQEVSQAQLQLELTPQVWSPVARALLLAKQQLGLALADRDSSTEADLLQSGLKFCEQALKQFKQLRKQIEPVLAQGLLAEILRTELSARYRLLMRGLDRLTPEDAQAGFEGLGQTLAALEAAVAALPEDTYRLQLSLYVRRERASIEIKRHEFLEQQRFSLALAQAWPEYAVLTEPSVRARAVILAVLAQPEQVRRLDRLYRLEQGVLVPDTGLDVSGAESLLRLRGELEDFLDVQRQLLDHGQSPEQLPAAGVLNTLLLQISVLARQQTFAHEGELLLKGLYLLANQQTLPAWHYVCAVFYACRFLMLRQLSDLDAALAAWGRWCQSDPAYPERYHVHRFRALLQEPCLWVACLLGLCDPDWASAGRRWLEPKWLTLIQEGKSL